MKKVAHQAVLGVILLAICLSSVNCYTVLRRPGKVTSEEDSYLGRDYYMEEWTGPRYLWYDPFYHWYYPDQYYRWRYYYTYPWWWNDYWFWHGDGEAPPVETDRYIWDRRRGPDWSSPPSTPRPPSSASQPREGQQRPQQGPPPTESPKDQPRRRPEWGRQPSHSPPPEQKTREEEGREEAKEAVEEQ
jgi:hypothetical protein